MIKIRGGVDRSSAKENMRQKFEIRRKLEQKYDIRGKNLLVIAARLVPFKGIKEFIVRLASAEICPYCHLLLLGDGKQREQILTLLENKNLSYTYLGKRSNAETMKYIAAADIFVNPTLEYTETCSGGSFIHTETMGRGMMEAITQGTPVLALNSGGTAELFYENRFIGYLADNHSEMMLCLEKAIESPCFVFADIDYSWDDVFMKYDRLFAYLIGISKAPILMAFDYDGTVKSDLCSETELSDIMDSNDNNAFVCLTARSAEEALPLIKNLPLKYLVYENGAGIAWCKGAPVFWNKFADEEKRKGDIEKIISKLKGTVEYKQTHPFTIHIKKEDVSEIVRKRIIQIICGTSFQMIESDKFIKIQHIIFNKKSALDYICKDDYYSYKIGAGDG